MATEGPVACAHCGLPAQAGFDDGELRFCCAGCRAVYHLLMDAGLERYYALRDGDSRPAVPTERSYQELDDPRFQELHVEALADGTCSTDLYLEGVHCTACVWLVERMPSVVPGVVDSRLDLGRSRASIRWDPSQVSASEIAVALDGFGYPVHPFRAEKRSELEALEDRRLLVQMAVAGAAAGNVMLMALAMYAGMFSDMGDSNETFFRWGSMLVTVPAVGFSARPFFKSAIGGLRARALHMDLPISVGISAALLGGVLNTVRGSGEIYFDSLTMLVFLLLIGRWLTARVRRRAMSAAEMLFSLTPRRARLVVGDHSTEVPIEAVTAGSIVEVLAGETVPVDGVVVEGESSVNHALLSGEAVPSWIEPGRDVAAGMVNVSAPLKIRATATGEETRVAKLAKRVEEYAARKPRIVRLADQLAGGFVAAALGLATLTVFLWWSHDHGQAMQNAMALLIVTCPCALGLATPLAMSVAVGRAARRGILIKGADVLERLARPGIAFVDKTGTLTQSDLRLVRWSGDESLKPLVAAIERGSSHPIARALADDPADATVTERLEVPGAGISARVAGRAIVLGTAALVESSIGPIAEAWQRNIDEMAGAGLTPVIIAADGEVAAVAGVGDPIRPEAESLVDALRRRGWRVGVLSGDHPEVVNAVATAVGADSDLVRGAATPEEKAQVVRNNDAIMVGDGVNDAAAMAAARCGIAVHGSAEASLAAADVFTDRPGLTPIAELFTAAGHTMAVIRRNLWFSLGYNLIGAGLAMTGLIHPLIAAVMMPLSSLTVITSSMRNRAFQDREAA